MNEIKHYYLHVDLDAFFASVEQLDNPQYRGKPVIVGGKPDDRRSVVSTASYEARKFGVHSAMPTAKAYQLCPQGIFVRGRMKRYSELSYQIMNIFRDFSPDVQQLSIDEAFIDLTGTEGLFGPPEQTALKIKERVKTETGLTVSAGLAPTKYLAKIASDMNKPDGFYKIDQGTEQEFMLSLPLKKVWGIGDKTLENLKRSGLNTTRDIYEKSQEALIFMYGQNTGTFLYNVVRGIEIINFDRKTKSHSISNETTFPYDLSNIYTAETAILELCHSVIFRLLKENGFSRTVQVKIRYEDFSTVSIQETYTNQILTLDSLYNAAKELFEKKYERGRGIRLIGIALENIENTERPVQQSLFDDGSEKKQNVEKAILNLEKKHPEIKIHKARMLEKLVFVFFICLSLFMGGQRLYAQEEESTLELSGSWKGSMEGSVKTTFGLGNPFGISATLPVFKQEVDLSALIHITQAFYFSLEFLDEFEHNTYTLGYNGNGWLQEFKFSNRGICFPDEYSGSVFGYTAGGGKNEAPGILLHFTDIKNQKWSGDFVVRYDMAEEKSAVFYGSNSVKDTKIELKDYVHSEMFVIPSSVITDIKDVYVQSTAGTYKDAGGRKYKKLTPSDYVVSALEKVLIISDGVNNFVEDEDEIPYILLTFVNPASCSQLLADTGSYSSKDSFAGQIQQYFSDNGNNNIDLSLYSDLEEQALTTQIDGQKAFIIQAPHSFSPYACANAYASPDPEGTEFLVADRYSDSQINDYSAKENSGIAAFTASDFFEKRQQRAYVYNSKAGQINPLSPAYRFPLADKYPFIYLSESVLMPLVLLSRTTTPVKHYDIGKYADAGSVKVYRNGILETGAHYDSDTGFVTLSSPVGELDKIYITYNEENSDYENGAFTTGAGFIYRFTPELTFDISFSGKYPYLRDNNNNQNSSFSSLSSGLIYDNGFIQAKDTVLAVYENQNQSGKLLLTDYSYDTLDDDEDEEAEEEEEDDDDDDEEDEEEDEEEIIPPANIDCSQGVVAQCIYNTGAKCTDIYWTDYSQDGGTINIVTYFAQADYSQYKTVNLDFGLTKAVDLEFILSNYDDTALIHAVISKEALAPYVSETKDFTKLKINLIDQTLFLNSNEIEKEKYTLEISKTGGTAPTKQKIIIKTNKDESGHLYLSSLYYKENEPLFSAKNLFAFKIGSDKHIGYLEAVSEQGLAVAANKQEDAANTDSRYVNSGIKGAITLAGIDFAADADLAWSNISGNPEVLRAAGHSVQTKNSLFKFLKFGEIYRFTPSGAGNENSLEKKDFVRLTAQGKTAGAELGAQTTAKSGAFTSTQNYSFDFNAQYNTEDTKLKAFSALYSNQKNNKKLDYGTYFYAWQDISGLQFSDGSDWDQRNVRFNTELSGSFSPAKLSPRFIYEITTARTDEDLALARTSEDLFKFLLPFTLRDNAFSFNLTHKAAMRQNTTEHKDDIAFLFENQKQFQNFYKAIPFYALFEKVTDMNDCASDSLSVQYELLWRRKLYNSIADLFIPFSTGAAVSRDIVNTDNSTSDIYQLKGVLGGKFINLFGSDSILQTFNWYRQDEYNGNLNITYRFTPQSLNSPVFLISTTEKILFYIQDSNVLSVSTDFFIDSDINWKCKLQTAWERNTSKSLLQSLSTAIWPKLLQNDLNTKVKDKITIIFSRKEGQNEQSYGYMRTSQMDFMTNYSVTSGAGIKFGYEEGKTFYLTLNYTLGAQISF